MRYIYLVLIAALSFFDISNGYAQSSYTSTDFFVPNGDLQIQVRKVTENTYSSRKKKPLLLVNGSVGATALFDLPVEDASFAKALADAGFTVYMMNVRGWERSTAPAYNTTDTALVAGSCQEASLDIDAVINYIAKDVPDGKVNLLGAEAGGHWASFYTSLHADKVLHLIVLNSLYGVKAPWKAIAVAIPNYNNWLLSEQAIANNWANTSATDTLMQVDSLVGNTFAKAATGYSPNRLLKIPGGFMKESLQMAQGKKYWDAKDITVPILLVRCEHDEWSRPEDLEAYFNELPAATPKKKLVISHADKYVALDRNTAARRSLIIAIDNFIKKGI
ncbi:lysophospholipase [Mucilaginibacter pallidiroseus]|uniref:Lysophospholipase n=1 Tax=Mucilaginibacter pallidiroseus TaxID=2599295 RepID=A0A563U542_9SPHI|nr:alpha/beta fold hydrolase [Mucilaginibacter pallidiroseus]TWR26457.1 lysophospholipase [Mucilaginibacter pallidiroseus]